MPGSGLPSISRIVTDTVFDAPAVESKPGGRRSALFPGFGTAGNVGRFSHVMKSSVAAANHALETRRAVTDARSRTEG
jgi:hypothetical protein